MKELQRALSADPSIFPPGLVTGFFGSKTQEALKKFQRKFGIFSVGSTTTGFFGPKSRGFLKEHCSSGDSDHDGIRNSDDSDDDNDDILDVDDDHPFISNSSSMTSPRLDDHGKDDGENRGRDGGGDSNDD